MTDKLTIRELDAADADAVLAIYQEGVDTGHATFETVAPAWQVFDQDHRPDCRLVGEIDGEVIAFAVLSPVSPRHVYRGVAAVSIYLKSGFSGVGYGNTNRRNS